MKLIKILFFSFFIFFSIKPETYDLMINKIKYQIDWKTEFTTANRQCYIIQILLNKQEVGHIKYDLEFKTKKAYISLIKINPNYRRNGIGRFIIKHVCSKIIKSANEISLEATPYELHGKAYEEMLPKLIALYKECGFDNPRQKNPHFLFYVLHKRKLLNQLISSQLPDSEILALMKASKL